MLEISDPMSAAEAVLDVFLAAMVAAVALRFILPSALKESCMNMRREHARFARGLHLVMVGFLMLAITTALLGIAPIWFRNVVILVSYPVFYVALYQIVSSTWDPDDAPVGVAE